MHMISAPFTLNTSEDLRRRLNENSLPMGPMAQEAMKVLSIRLPEVLSGRPAAPRDLSDLVSQSLAPGDV
jgi:hypothetical protein